MLLTRRKGNLRGNGGASLVLLSGAKNE